MSAQQSNKIEKELARRAEASLLGFRSSGVQNNNNPSFLIQEGLKDLKNQGERAFGSIRSHITFEPEEDWCPYCDVPQPPGYRTCDHCGAPRQRKRL